MISLKVCTTNYQMCVCLHTRHLPVCGMWRVAYVMFVTCVACAAAATQILNRVGEWMDAWMSGRVSGRRTVTPPTSHTSHSRAECQQVYISLPQLKCDCGFVQVLSAVPASTVHSPPTASYFSQQSALHIHTHTHSEREAGRERRLSHIFWANQQVALSGAPQLQYQQKPPASHSCTNTRPSFPTY